MHCYFILSHSSRGCLHCQYRGAADPRGGSIAALPAAGHTRVNSTRTLPWWGSRVGVAPNHPTTLAVSTTLASAPAGAAPCLVGACIMLPGCGRGSVGASHQNNVAR
jgi:hypothetical protein